MLGFRYPIGHVAFSLATNFNGFLRASKKRLARVSVAKPMTIWQNAKDRNILQQLIANIFTHQE